MKVAESGCRCRAQATREQSEDYVDVRDRGLEMEDFVVIDFEGSVDGKPISEVAPQASKTLQGGKKFWLRVAPNDSVAKCATSSSGAKEPGETREVKVELPTDFAVKRTGERAILAVAERN